MPPAVGGPELGEALPLSLMLRMKHRFLAVELNVPGVRRAARDGRAEVDDDFAALAFRLHAVELDGLKDTLAEDVRITTKGRLRLIPDHEIARAPAPKS